MDPALHDNVFALRLDSQRHFVDSTAEIEVHFTIPSVRKRTRPRVPVIVRDAAPNGLVVVVSKEDGWLYKSELDLNSEMSRNTPIRLRFNIGARAWRLTGRVVWSEGGQAGVRLELADADDDVRDAFERWVAKMANAATD